MSGSWRYSTGDDTETAERMPPARMGGMMKSFVISAVATFAFAVVSGVAILPADGTPGPRTVEFTTSAPNAPRAVAPPTPVGALEAARLHADDNGLIDCVAPMHARLDDVILTVPSDPAAGVTITQVGFDEALESGAQGRWNVLACKVVDG